MFVLDRLSFAAECISNRFRDWSFHPRTSSNDDSGRDVSIPTKLRVDLSKRKKKAQHSMSAVPLSKFPHLRCF